MNEQFKYDVFISHSEKDKPAARELAERLRRDGLRVWFDDWQIKRGDAIPRKIQEGLEQSRALVLVMSQHASASEWVTFEHHSALFRDPTNQQRRLIPVRLDNTEGKNALRQFASIDWRHQTDEQYAQLLSSCSPLAIASLQQGAPQPVKVIENHLHIAQCIAITPDGQVAVSGSMDKTVGVWELQTGRCLAILEGHTTGVWVVTVTADGHTVASGSTDSTVRVWDVQTGRCLGTLKADVVSPRSKDIQIQ